MKIFIFLPLIAFAYAADDWHPKTPAEINAIRGECLAAHPLPEGTLAKIRSFEYPDEEAVRQYLLCSVTKLGIFCDHNGFHTDRVAQQFKTDLKESQVLAITEGCFDSNEQGSATDVWAFRGYTCLMASKIGDGLRNFIKNKLETDHSKL